MAALVFALRTGIPPNSWVLLIAEIAAGLILYGALAVRYCLEDAQRQAVLGYLRGVMRRMTA